MSDIEFDVVAGAILQTFAATNNLEGMPHAWLVEGMPTIEEIAIIESEFALHSAGLVVRHETIPYVELTPEGVSAVQALIDKHA